MATIARRQRQSYAKCALRMQQSEDGQIARSGGSGQRIVPEMRSNPLMFRQDGLLGTLAAHCRAQRFEPFRKPAAQRPGQLLVPACLAVKCRPPFDKGAVAIDNGRDAQRRLETAHRQRGRAAEFVGLRALDVGQRQKPLADAALLIEHVPNRANRVAGFAVLDPAFAGTANPDSIIVEIADDFPDVRSRFFEYSAVIGLCHFKNSYLTPMPTDNGLPDGAYPPDLRSGAHSAARNQLKIAAKPPFR